MLTGCDHTSCGYHTALTDQGPVRVAIDGRSVALEPTQQSRARLLTMANPVIHFGIGTYGASDGAVNGPEEMPVVVLRKDVAPNPGLLKPVRFLESAIYDADDHRLSLEFGWEVDPYSVNTGLIRLTGSHANNIVNITLSDHGFNLLDGDLFHIVVESDSGTIRDVLQSLTDMTVHLGFGAYKSLYGGVPNDVEETPVAVWVTLLERAEYNIDSNKLTLNFAEEVDPLYADHIPIAIQDGCCFGTAFRPLNIQVGDDGKSIIYEPRTSSRNDLLVFSDPRVQLFQGVYARSTDGLVNGFEEVPVTVQGSSLAALLERAKYDVNSNEVTLHFTDAIDLPTLQVRDITITGCDNAGCSSVITLTDQGPVRMASDGKSVVLEPTQHGRLKLLVMTNPTIHLGAGTYRTADGTINEPEKASVMVIREAYSPNVLADGALLTSAEYSADIGRLTLNFNDSIELSSVDIGRIRLAGLHSTTDIGTLLHDQGFYQIGSSPHQLIFVHDLRWQDLLLSIDNLSIHLDPGAYKSLSGVINNAEETQVRILGRVA